MARLRFIARSLMALAATVPALGAIADPTELQKTLQDAMQGKVLMIRGFPIDQKITYDRSLRPISQVHPDSWTLSNIQVDAVTVSPGLVEISGKHVSYGFNELTRQFVQVPEKQDVHIRIEGELEGTANEVLDRVRSQIFLWEKKDVYAALPDLWKEYFNFAAEQARKSKEEPKLIARPKFDPSQPPPADWTKLKPPQLTYRARPSLPPHHELMNVGAMLEIDIDTDGSAKNVHLRGPIGMGYDERAVEAISKWRFRPATKDGKPLTTRMSIVVSFTSF